MNASQLKLGERTRVTLSKVVAMSPSCEGVPEAVAQLKSQVLDLPDEVTIHVLSEISPSSVGVGGPNGVAELFNQLANHLKGLLAISAYRTVTMTETVLSCLETGRYSEAALVVRALVEHHAVSSKHWPELNQKVGLALEQPVSEVLARLRDRESTEVFSRVLGALEGLILAYGRGRFSRDWFSGKLGSGKHDIPKDDPYRQVQIMTALDKLRWRGPRLAEMTPRSHYELVCDYVHPNAGANMLFVDRETRRKHPMHGGETLCRTISARPKDISLLSHVLELLCVPLRESIRGHIELIEELAARAHRAEQTVDGFRRLGVMPASELP